MNRTRPKQIVIRMTEDEYDKIKKKIEKSGMSQQEYAIKTLMGKPITNTDGIKQVVPELKRVGNNLNQIARQMNMFEHVPYEEIEQMRKELSETWQWLRRLAQEQA